MLFAVISATGSLPASRANRCRSRYGDSRPRAMWSPVFFSFGRFLRILWI